MANMGKLEPSVLVIPNPLRTELVSECLPIEIKYLQEDFVGKVVDCHGSGRRPATITGANVSFGRKLVGRESQLVEHTVAEGIPQG